MIQTMHLTGKERILDLACGYGRHALSLAQRGYTVVGVDITKEYIEDARKSAAKLALQNIEFIHSDIREVYYENEFDVVLNLADGAIGYLENNEENLKIFDVIAKALKPGGVHCMDICNAEYADRYFPMRGWEIGTKSLALSEFEWNPDTRIMLFGGADIPFGQPAEPPVISEGDPTRLYSLKEINGIMEARGMRVEHAFCDFYGKPASGDDLQLIIFSKK